MNSGDAMISVDAKKEHVGIYKDNGHEWNKASEPVQVKVHDFIDSALGKANTYGVYDVTSNTGWVRVEHRGRCILDKWPPRPVMGS